MNTSQGIPANLSEPQSTLDSHVESSPDRETVLENTKQSVSDILSDPGSKESRQAELTRSVDEGKLFHQILSYQDIDTFKDYLGADFPELSNIISESTSTEDIAVQIIAHMTEDEKTLKEFLEGEQHLPDIPELQPLYPKIVEKALQYNHSNGLINYISEATKTAGLFFADALYREIIDQGKKYEHFSISFGLFDDICRNITAFPPKFHREIAELGMTSDDCFWFLSARVVEFQGIEDMQENRTQDDTGANEGTILT